ncbi:hypothetical protein CFSAN002367_20077 [Clostridium botulinum CFSAN002367]|nr:hypothetical protein CFSAN002367_20077 [Clostridium botulinum CFSAN002367]
MRYIKEKNSNIQKGLAKYVYNVEFISRFENEIKTVFDKFNLKFEKIDSQFMVFTYKYKFLDSITLQMSIQKFTENFSNIFYGINKFDKDEIFKYMLLKNEQSNINEFVGIMEHILKDNKYYFKYDIDLYQKQIIEVHIRNSTKFGILRIKDIMNKYIKILYLSDKESKTFILKEIDKVNIWMDDKEKDKFDIGNIASVWAKEKIN